MKYLLFAGWNYYPRGGFKDLKGIFDTLEEAQKGRDEYYKSEGCKVGSDDSYCWYHIVDSESNKTIEESE